jgi:hypothetical protein
MYGSISPRETERQEDNVSLYPAGKAFPRTERIEEGERRRRRNAMYEFHRL